MRTIKFRGYSGDGVWTYMTLNGGRWDFKTFPLKEGTVLNPNEWQQFTGLLDKNGKEIFEGDIVVANGYYTNAQVVYAAPNWWIEQGKGICIEFRWDEWEKFEIIGNVWESPELLK